LASGDYTASQGGMRQWIGLRRSPAEKDEGHEVRESGTASDQSRALIFLAIAFPNGPDVL